MELFTEYQTASPERKAEIESVLVQRHRGLAYHVAKRYFNLFGLDDQEDIRQEAMIALLQAIRTFDPTRENTFATYAIVVIRNHFTPFLQKRDSASLSSTKKRIACTSLDEIAADPEKRTQYQEALKINDISLKN